MDGLPAGLPVRHSPSMLEWPRHSLLQRLGRTLVDHSCFLFHQKRLALRILAPRLRHQIIAFPWLKA
ncbi:hypothetical protein PMJ6TS7_53220 [Paenibacillus melissococcoides]